MSTGLKQAFLKNIYIFIFIFNFIGSWASQVALVVKNLPANAGDVRDVGLIPELERYPGEEHGIPF